MFANTKKAFERAPTVFGGHHQKDKDIQIWTVNFSAAKVAMNTLDRDIKESQRSINLFIKQSLDIYGDMVSVRTCDSAVPGTPQIPDTLHPFDPLKETVEKIDRMSQQHANKIGKYIHDIRSFVQSIEQQLHHTDHKKIDCDKVCHRENIEYDDPKAAEFPEVKDYLMLLYHMKSLIPQALTKIETSLQQLVKLQNEHLMEVFELAGAAIKKCAVATNVPLHKDNVEILQSWSREIQPVVEQLSKTKTIGAFAVFPPHPNTWQHVQHLPQAVAHTVPNVKQTKDFASNIGSSFHYGFSYIYRTDVKFFNPSKGMFGDHDEKDMQNAIEGKTSQPDVSEEKASEAAGAGAGAGAGASAAGAGTAPSGVTNAPTTTSADGTAPGVAPADVGPPEGPPPSFQDATSAAKTPSTTAAPEKITPASEGGTAATTTKDTPATAEPAAALTGAAEVPSTSAAQQKETVPTTTQAPLAQPVATATIPAASAAVPTATASATPVATAAPTATASATPVATAVPTSTAVPSAAPVTTPLPSATPGATAVSDTVPTSSAVPPASAAPSTPTCLPADKGVNTEKSVHKDEAGETVSSVQHEHVNVRTEPRADDDELL